MRFTVNVELVIEDDSQGMASIVASAALDRMLRAEPHVVDWGFVSDVNESDTP